MIDAIVRNKRSSLILIVIMMNLFFVGPLNAQVPGYLGKVNSAFVSASFPSTKMEVKNWLDYGQFYTTNNYRIPKLSLGVERAVLYNISMIGYLNMFFMPDAIHYAHGEEFHYDCPFGTHHFNARTTDTMRTRSNYYGGSLNIRFYTEFALSGLYIEVGANKGKVETTVYPSTYSFAFDHFHNLVALSELTVHEPYVVSTNCTGFNFGMGMKNVYNKKLILDYGVRTNLLIKRNKNIDLVPLNSYFQLVYNNLYEFYLHLGIIW